MFAVPLHPQNYKKIKNDFKRYKNVANQQQDNLRCNTFYFNFFLFLDYIPGLQAWSAWVTPPVALFLGLIFALTCGQAHPKFNKKTSKYLLQYSVVGLGFGMNLQSALASGKEGMEFTVISVVGTLLIGWFIGRKIFKIDRNTSYLISSGTAICGGSAIAAVGPVLRAKDSEMSVALGTIFILNAIALLSSRLSDMLWI